MFRILLILGLLGAAVVPMPSHAETYSTCNTFITTLPTTISTQGVYCLKQDLSVNLGTGNAITVNTNNVTIDCNGHKVGDLAAGSGTLAKGIYAGNRNNVRVRNCNIRGFLTGAYLTGSGHAIEDSIFDSNTYLGIYVSGDGGLIRDNQVIATGGGTENTSALGIYGYLNVDIRGNRVDGVVGTTARNVTVYGINLGNGVGGTIIDNIVRNLAPSGTGTANGIYTSNGAKVVMDSNHVTLSATVAGSQGYRCNASNGSMRNSTSWGFETGITGCYDDGGNSVH